MHNKCGRVRHILCSAVIVALALSESTSLSAESDMPQVTISHLADIFDAQLARIHTLEIHFENVIRSFDADGKEILKAEEYYIVRASGENRYAEKRLVAHDGAEPPKEITERYAITPEWTKYVAEHAGHPVAQGRIEPPLRGKFAYFDPVYGVFHFGTPMRLLAEDNKQAEISIKEGTYHVSKKVGTHLAELIVVDPQRGFLPIRHTGFGIDGGSTTMEVVSAAEIEDGLWLATEVYCTNIMKNRREAKMEQHFKVTEYAVNKPLSADALTFAFPRYTEVSDTLSGLRYWIDNPADQTRPHPPRADSPVVDQQAIQPRPATNGALEEVASKSITANRTREYSGGRFVLLMALGATLVLVAGLLKWVRSRRAVAALVPVLAMLYGSTTFAALVAEPAVLELGDVSPDVPITKVIKITNVGKRSVVVTEILRTCNCSDAQIEKAELGPGEATRLLLRIDGKGRTGPFQSKLVLRSSQPGEQTQIAITGSFRNVERPEAMPRKIDFGTVGAGQTIERRVMINGIMDPSTLSFTSDVSWISILPEEMVSLRGGGRWYRLQATAPSEATVYSGVLHFRPSASKTVEVPYTLEVARKTPVSPEVVLVNTYSARPVTQRIVFALSDATLQVEEVSASSHVISVVSVGRSEVNPLWLNVTLRSEPIADGFQEAVLKFAFHGGEAADVRCLAPPGLKPQEAE